MICEVWIYVLPNRTLFSTLYYSEICLAFVNVTFSQEIPLCCYSWWHILDNLSYKFHEIRIVKKKKQISNTNKGKPHEFKKKTLPLLFFICSLWWWVMTALEIADAKVMCICIYDSMMYVLHLKFGLKIIY